MKRAMAVVLLAAGLAACASNGVKTEPSSSGPVEATVEQSAAKPSAAVGDTIALSSTDSKADVTVVQIIDPAQSTLAGIKPKDGERFVGVQLKLVNTGTNALDEFPANGLKVIDPNGQSFSATFTEIAGCPAFAGGTVKLAPGDTALGCITVGVPLTSTIAKVQFGLASGFAETGQWTVG